MQLDLQEQVESQVIAVWIRVYSPVYEEGARNWRFEFWKTHETIDISKIDFAENAIKRGGAVDNDTYKVKLAFTQIITPSGTFKNRYKIKEILEFHPAKLACREEFLVKINLKETRKQNKLKEFVNEHSKDPKGGAEKIDKPLDSIVRPENSKSTQEKSSQDSSESQNGTQIP